MSDRYTIAPDGSSITCTACGLTSYNANDIAQKFCCHCGVFHDDEQRNEILRAPDLSAMVKRVMLRFWRRLDELKKGSPP